MLDQPFELVELIRGLSFSRGTVKPPQTNQRSQFGKCRHWLFLFIRTPNLRFEHQSP